MFRKQTVLNTLFPYYRHICPSMHFAFTNYNSLNFISSSTFPDNSALLYPQTVALSGNLITSAQYAVSGAFTFDFWIKPNATEIIIQKKPARNICILRIIYVEVIIPIKYAHEIEKTVKTTDRSVACWL